MNLQVLWHSSYFRERVKTCFHFYPRGYEIFIHGVYKKEGSYLDEWINYHREIGFSHVVLVDNNHKDDELDIANSLKQNPRVIYQNMRNKVFSGPAQGRLHNQFYQTLKKTQWCLFIDIDEYFTLPDGMTLFEYLDRAKKKKCQQIKLNWMIFGNNGKKIREPGPVFKRFPKPVLPLDFKIDNKTANCETKGFVSGGLKGRMTNHFFLGNITSCNGELKYTRTNLIILLPPNWKIGYLRHYYTRSEEEYREKITKRWDTKYNRAGRYNWKFYNLINANPPNVPHIDAGNDTDAVLFQNFLHIPLNQSTNTNRTSLRKHK